MQRRLCEMSEAKWSITEAKCLQISHNKYASQRDAISHSMGNLMLSHSAGMHNTDKSIAGISKRLHFASLHYIFSAYLPTHIKFLTEFRCIFFGAACILLSILLMNFQCSFYPKSVIRACGILKKSFHVLMTDLGLWLGWIWKVWLLLLGFLGGEFLFVVFEVFA